MILWRPYGRFYGCPFINSIYYAKFYLQFWKTWCCGLTLVGIRTRNSITTSHQQAGVQPLSGKQGSSHVTVSFEDKYHHTKCCVVPQPLHSFLLLYPSFIAGHNTALMWDISLVNLGQLSWLCPLADPGAPPASLLAGQCKNLKSPWLHVSTALQQLKILVCYDHYFHQQSKTYYHISLYKEHGWYMSQTCILNYLPVAD